MDTNEVIITAKTVEEATQKALAALGADIADVEIEILTREKKGVMGIGSQEAKVRASVRETPEIRGEEYITELLGAMGISSYRIETAAEDQAITYNITSEEDVGFVIGYHGDVLDALSSIVSMAVNRDSETHYRVNVDLNSYRQKRIESLREYAERAIQKAHESEFVTVANPMKPYERLVLHTAVQDTLDVVSWSEGEEPRRRVIIAPLSKVKKAGDHYERTDRASYGEERRPFGNADHSGGSRPYGNERRPGPSRNTPRPKLNGNSQPVGGDAREKKTDFGGSLYGKIEPKK